MFELHATVNSINFSLWYLGQTLEWLKHRVPLALCSADVAIAMMQLVVGGAGGDATGGNSGGGSGV